MNDQTKNTALLSQGISVAEIAKLISAKLLGGEHQLVHSFCSLTAPVKSGLSFAKSSSSKELKEALSTGLLAAVIVSKEISKHDAKEVAQLVVADPLEAISILTKKFLGVARPEAGISKNAEVHASAKIGKGVHVGAFCSIGAEVVIEDGAVLYPHVVVYEGVTIGKNSVIHSGAVIREYCRLGEDCLVQNGAVVGADGFGYFLNSKKKLQAVPQVGNVELGSEVEIGANTCIDRATMGSTVVSDMTKIDNLVQVGHNTKIGQGSIVCGNVGIAGSCDIGSGVTLGGGTGVADHIKIASGIRVGGNSGVTSHLTEKGDYIGYPIVKAGEWRRQVKSLEKLPKLISKINRLLGKGENDED